jgi:hypothetical protein
LVPGRGFGSYQLLGPFRLARRIIAVPTFTEVPVPYVPSQVKEETSPVVGYVILVALCNQNRVKREHEPAQDAPPEKKRKVESI